VDLAAFARLDAATRTRIESACAFVNNRIKEQRRKVLNAGAIALTIAVGVWALTGVDPRIPGFAALAIVALIAGHAQRDIRKWYKLMVIKRVVEALGEGLTYDQQSSLDQAQFREMDLYNSRIDSWKSEDQVSGRRREVAFELHEVRAIRREKQGKHTREVVVFQGLVVVLEFNKNFHGHTVVVPDKDGRILGGLFGESESRRNKQIVRLENVDFENTYSVYTTDGQEAHYLLTPKLMELVLRARAELGANDVRLAFFRNSLFVTVPSSQNRFEVSLFSNQVTAMSAITDLAAVVALAEQLIDVLQLETRIWTRA
jgi:hypothetical protein